MPTVQVHPVLLLLPAIAIGAYVGYRRGWQREAITAAGVAIAIVLLWNGPGLVLGLVGAALERIGRVVRAVIGGDGRADAAPLSVATGTEPIVTLALLAVAAVLAYVVGSRLGRGRVDRTGRWCGAVIGGLILFTLMSRAVGTMSQLGPANPGVSGVNIHIPSFPGLNIVVPPPPESALLVSWPLAALVVLIVSIMVFALLRMARA